MSFLQNLSKPLRDHISNSFFLSNSANRNIPFSDLLKRWASHLEIASAQEFKDKLADKKSAVVAYFYKPECHFCKIFEEKLTNVMKDTKDVEYVKVNVMDRKDLVEQYEIEAVPTVMGFRNGKEVDVIRGNVDKDVIERVVSKLK
ncbi:hypothetical protein WDU94_008575 [Cyamophila willieti]